MFVSPFLGRLEARLSARAAKRHCRAARTSCRWRRQTRRARRPCGPCVTRWTPCCRAGAAACTAVAARDVSARDDSRCGWLCGSYDCAEWRARTGSGCAHVAVDAAPCAVAAPLEQRCRARGSEEGQGRGPDASLHGPRALYSVWAAQTERSPVQRLPEYCLKADGTPDYVRLILSSRVYDLVQPSASRCTP